MLTMEEEIDKVRKESKTRIERLKAMDEFKLAWVFYDEYNFKYFARYIFDGGETYDVVEYPIFSPVLVRYQHKQPYTIHKCLEMAVKRQVFDMGRERCINAFMQSPAWPDENILPSKGYDLIVPVNLYRVESIVDALK